MLRIKIVELFAGIGAVRRALDELTGVRSQTLFVSEINRRKREVYQALFPESKVSKMLGDIRKVEKSDVIEYRGECDLLFLGSPCQDFSQAGLNRGGGYMLIPVLV